MANLRDVAKREFQAGLESSRIRTVKDARIRGIQLSVAVLGAIFWPGRWWAKILAFLGIMFVIGVVVQYREIRRIDRK